MQRLVQSRPLLWAILAMPAAWLAWNWSSGSWTYGEAVSQSGLWSAQLLIATLAVTPLRRLFKRSAWVLWLVQRRRDLGVASFAYAALHTGIYVLRKLDPGLILSEALDPWLLAGWVSLLIMLALALTSTDGAVRWMRRGWKRLHRFVYLAAALLFVHWVLSAFDPLTAYLHLAALLAIEAVRLPQLIALTRQLTAGRR